MTTLAKLRAKLLTRNGTFRRGALSRASEHLGVSRTTIRNWFFTPAIGEKWTPGKATLAKIDDVLRADKSFEPKKCGPKVAANQAFTNNRNRTRK